MSLVTYLITLDNAEFDNATELQDVPRVERANSGNVLTVELADGVDLGFFSPDLLGDFTQRSYVLEWVRVTTDAVSDADDALNLTDESDNTIVELLDLSAVALKSSFVRQVIPAGWRFRILSGAAAGTQTISWAISQLPGSSDKSAKAGYPIP